MAEPFSFGFTGDDVDYGADEDDSVAQETRGEMPVVHNNSQKLGNEPTLHTLEDMISVLPSRISYSSIRIQGIDGRAMLIPHRDVHDIRAQIMAEDVSPEASADRLPAIGLSTDDITPNVYEGGFKTWECSEDLAAYTFSILDAFQSSINAEHHIIELGAGTALSTCILFLYLLNIPSPSWRTIHLSFADYNLSVLELATVPNLLLTWYFSRPSVTQMMQGDIEITPGLISQFFNDLLTKELHLSAISGAWNSSFSDLIKPFDEPQRRTEVETTILASETIYSPSSMIPFTEVLIKALGDAEKVGGKAKALVAAKKLYFGVGGSVDEFYNVLERLGGLAATVWESENPGVGRVILEVRRA